MPKLDVNAVTYLTVKEEASFRHDLELSDDSVTKILNNLRIEGIPRPKDHSEDALGPTPIEIDRFDSLTNDELGGLFLEYTGWAQFLRVEAAKQKARYLSAKSVLKRLAIKLKKSLLERGFSKEELPGEIQNNPFYEEVAIEVDVRQISAEMLDAYRASYANTADALSRIITLRGQENETGHRANTYGNYKKRGTSISNLRRRGATVKEPADDED